MKSSEWRVASDVEFVTRKVTYGAAKIKLGLAEVDQLVGDASKAHRVLGWQPSVSFRELVCVMVDANLALLRRENGL